MGKFTSMEEVHMVDVEISALATGAAGSARRRRFLTSS
jgi:hypothetical protein